MCKRIARRRLGSLGILMLIGAVGLVLLVRAAAPGTGPSPVAIAATGTPVSPEQRAIVASRTEELHNRASARLQEPADKVHDSISPEQAVNIARQLVQTQGPTAANSAEPQGQDGTKVTVELRSENGAQVYVVRVQGKEIRIDAVTGKVIGGL